MDLRSQILGSDLGRFIDESMRSYRPVKASNQDQVEYYTKDESLKQSKYYSTPETASESEVVTSAVWMGAEAEAQNLTGFVSQAEIEAVMVEGVLPETGERIRGFKKSGREQLAFDWTLSAPKSFSMHAVKDLRLFEAHTQAVEKTLAQIEKRYSYARVGQQRTHIIGGRLMAAAIPHWTSRELDMQLHTHLLIMNGVHCPDGKWRALDDRPLSRATWLGSYYRNELAKATQALGYKIEESALNDGYSFEIIGPSRNQREAFSKRSRQITEAVAALETKFAAEGIDAVVHRNDVVGLDRKAKHIDQTWEELRQGWIEQLRPVSLQSPQSQPVPRLGYGDAAAELESAIRHFSERSVSFRREDLYKYAFDHIQNFDIDAYDACIDNHPSLITLDSGQFTTAELLIQELDIIESWQHQCQTAVMPLATEIEFTGIKLNSGQQEAVTRTLQNTIRHQIIQGISGAGKTTALRQIALNSNLPVYGFSPTIKAAQELEASLNIPTQTVESLVLKGAQSGLWIIDEAGLKSARQMHAVLKLAEQTDSRILLVGDTGQNSAVEAGSPMASLMNHGAATHRISTIIRQQNQEQKRAVELLAEGKGAEAIAYLHEHGYIHEKQNSRVRAKNVAKHYMTKLAEYQTPKKLIIVTGTNAERQRVTTELRRQLKESGHLGQSIDATQLINRGLTREQARQARSYRTGDYIKLGYTPKASALNKSTTYQVTDVLNKTLKISSPGGRIYEIDPSQVGNPQVYYSRPVDFAIGDRVVFRATDRQRGYTNGQELEITAIEGTTLTGTDRHGQDHQIDVSEPIPLDHAWAGTSYKWQGSKAYEAIVSLTSDPTSSRNPVYVSVSRQTHCLQVFTEDYDQLRRWAGVDNRQPNVLEDLSYDRTDRRDHLGPQSAAQSAEHHRSAVAPESGPDVAESSPDDGGEKLNPIESAPASADSIAAASALDAIRRAVARAVERRDQRAIDDGVRGTIGQTAATIGFVGGYPQTVDSERGGGHRGSAQQQGPPDHQWGEHSQDPGSNGGHSPDRLSEWFIERRIGQSVATPLGELAAALTQLQSAKAELQWTELELRQRIMEAARDARVRLLSRALRQWQQNTFTAEAQPKAAVVVDEVLSQLGPIVREAMRPPPPKPYQPFWPLNYDSGDRPLHVNEQHWQEMQESGIHPDLVAANISSIEGDAVYERLIGDQLAEMGSGQFVTRGQRRRMIEYRLPAKGGWWGTAGVDSHTFEPSLWGCFKADHPRVDLNKSKPGEEEYIKYEHPLGMPRALYLANVPDDLARQILAQHKVKPQSGEHFWETVIRENLPIVVVEGLKKTLASLSQGHITVGLSGVNALYRAKDEQRQRLPNRELNPDFLPFCTEGRSITFAFDQDEKIKTILNVRRDMVRAIELIEPMGPSVKVAQWEPDQGKGVDDLIVETGPLVYDRAIEEAQDSERSIRSHYRREYNRFSETVQGVYQDLLPEQVDVLVYIEAVNRGDNVDGDRVLMQSDAVRAEPEVGEGYVAGVKELAAEQYLRNRRAAQLGRELLRLNGTDGRWVVGPVTFVEEGDRFRVLKDGQPVLVYDTKLKRVSGIVNQTQVEVMQRAIDRHNEIDRGRGRGRQKGKDKGISPDFD